MAGQQFSPGRTFAIMPAKHAGAWLRAGLIGPSGSGKTYSALRIASGIANTIKGDIIMLDTENNRGRYYADQFSFDHVDMGPPFGSADYHSAIETISARKPAVMIIDTLSHEHDGQGGLLDAYDRELERMAGDDTALAMRLQQFAWRRPRASRRALLALIMRTNCHMIFCVRASERTRHVADRTEQSHEQGLTPITGQEFLYEMTFSALLHPASNGRPTWSSHLRGEAGAIKRPEQLQHILNDELPLTEETGRQLAHWAQTPPRSPTTKPGARPAKPRRKATRTSTDRNGQDKRTTRPPRLAPGARTCARPAPNLTPGPAVISPPARTKG